MEIDEKLLAQYADPSLKALPPELMERGGAHYATAALRLIESIAGDKGEVQVVNDILGLSDRIFRHTKRFAAGGEAADRALHAYVDAVRGGCFPAEGNATHLPPQVLETLGDQLAVHARQTN